MLRPPALAGGVTMLCAGVNGALVYAVVEDLGRSPAYAGVLYAVQGAGSVATGLLPGPAQRRLGARRFAAYGIGLLAVALALRAAPYDPAAWASSAAIGTGLPAAPTSVQRRTPGPLLGRECAATTLVHAPNVIGLATGAPLAELLGRRAQLIAPGVVLGVTAAVLGQRSASADRTAARSASDASPA